jgi:hypothetical protein
MPDLAVGRSARIGGRLSRLTTASVPELQLSQRIESNPTFTFQEQIFSIHSLRWWNKSKWNMMRLKRNEKLCL